MAELTYRDAVARGIAQEMARDPDVVFLGEDVAKAGGVFKATVGLYEQFGPLRVRDTPISEQAILGAAMGAAMTGLKPIAEIMFSDFFAVCFDYIANEFPKSRYMSNGQLKCPLVVRTGNGAGSRFGAQHSQSVENWCMMIPGLKVVAPSTPRDVIGLLAAAVRDPDPVIFFEHKSLYATKGEVPDGEIVDTLGTAKIVRPGKDATILALALMVPRALAAAERLQGGARHRLRSDRRALAGAARHADHPRLGRARPTACSRSRRIRGSAAGAPRSSRSSPTRRSTISTARRCGSPRRISRCPPPTCSKTSVLPNVDRDRRPRCRQSLRRLEPSWTCRACTTICSPTSRPISRSAASGARPPTARASTSIDPATENDDRLGRERHASRTPRPRSTPRERRVRGLGRDASRASAARSCARPSS